MRTAGFLLLLCLGVASVGCKNKGDADAAPDPTALKAQQELLARREKLLKARADLKDKADKLDLEISDIESKGGDASEKKKERAQLDSEVDKELEQVNDKLDQMKKTGDKSAQVAAREADIAAREARVADREARIADREKQIVQRDSELAQRWKDTCASSSTPVIIQQAAAKPGGNYTKKDVSDLISKAKATMGKKGILLSDLPGPAQGLEGDASKAMNENDMSKAYFAAAQLSGQVDAIQVNRQFIQTKMARVQAQIKSSKPDDATNQQLTGILSDVIQKYSEGQYAKANERLNALIGMLK